MMAHWKKLLLICYLLAISGQKTIAQIVSDGSLNTSVVNSGNITNIVGGTQIGTNLFHSFSGFSISKDNTAYFQNPYNITNIISRVTGNDISIIDGIIKSNGNANLFIINPNGFIFNQNATLNIGGSFIAATANQITFADGGTFTTNLSSTSVLSDLEPSRIIIPNNSGEIQINNLGGDPNHISQFFPTTFIFPGNGTINLPNNGLTTSQNNSLILLGNGIELNGGIISSSGGQIFLGSVSSGSINISRNNGAFTLDYSGSDLNDISFYNRSQVLVNSYTGNSEISLFGQNITIKDGTQITLISFDKPDYGIFLNSTQSISIDGGFPINPDLIYFGIQTESAISSPSNIYLSSPQISLTNGGEISSHNLSNSPGANIFIESNSLTIQGSNPFSILVSAITSDTFTSGSGSNISINSKNINILDGGEIAAFSSIFSSGNGGNISINAENITVSGIDSKNIFNSALLTYTVGNGNAGKLNLSTENLFVYGGAGVGSFTIGSGNSGDVTIISDDIELSGFSLNPQSASPRSIITSNNLNLGQAVIDALGIPTPTFTGNAGNLSIQANNINISNGGLITVSNNGSGNSGNLSISAINIFLDNGTIEANANFGFGGNINLDDNLLVLRNNSAISASSGGIGTGGNIDIVSQDIVGDASSSITANATSNFGGNIRVIVGGIVFADGFQLSASSNLGPQFDGEVQVNTNFKTPNTSFTFSKNSPDIKPLLKCSDQESVLSHPSAGDTPPTLTDHISLADFSKPDPIQTSLFISDRDTGKKIRLVEPVGWKKNDDGTISFVANKADAIQYANQFSHCQQAVSSSDLNHDSVSLP